MMILQSKACSIFQNVLGYMGDRRLQVLKRMDFVFKMMDVRFGGLKDGSRARK